jgi:hypothetical protein
VQFISSVLSLRGADLFRLVSHPMFGVGLLVFIPISGLLEHQSRMVGRYGYCANKWWSEMGIDERRRQRAS